MHLLRYSTILCSWFSTGAVSYTHLDVYKRQLNRRKMRKLYIIFMLLGMLLVTSCSDWLDVAPSNQVNDDKMFSNGDGYRNALNGVYSKMSTESMYGLSLIHIYLWTLCIIIVKQR